MGRHLKAVETSFVRKTSHELLKLLRNLRKEEDKAVQILSKLMEEAKDEKVQLAACQTLIKFIQDISNQIDQDEFRRIVGQLKFKLGGDDSGDLQPTIDYEIQEVD